MGVTGLALIGFLVTHLAGNFLLFAGPKTFNHYSHTLTSNPLIYLAEAVLLGLFLAHFASGLMVTLRNKGARPVPYQAEGNSGRPSRRDWASQTMIVSGLVVAVFVPLHVWGFKFGRYYASPEPGVRDLHRLVVETFQNPGWVLWYVFAMSVIGFHLWHGFGSSFESLGVRWRRVLSIACKVGAIVIAGGFLAIPLLVYIQHGGR